jgi:hypothetical protein
MYESISTSPQLSDQKAICNVAKLARFFFILGQTSLSVLVYTERLAGIAKSNASLASKQALTASQKKGTDKSMEDETDAMEEEMGVTAALDADHEMVSLLRMMSYPLYGKR